MVRDLGISNAQAGALISVFLVAIIIFQLPAGYLIDRRDPRPIIILSGLSVLLLGAVIWVFPRYDVLLPFRFLGGIPLAFIFIPSAYLVSKAFAERPGMAVGLFLSGPPTGVAIGSLLGPIVGELFGWPAVFIAFTLPVLVFVPLFAVFSRSFPSYTREPSTVADYLATFRAIELWKVGAIFACSYAAYIFFSSWSPTFLEANGVSNPLLIGLVAAAIPAAGILARPIGGYLAEGRFSHDKRLVLFIAFGFLFVVSVLGPFAGIGAIPLLIAGGFLSQAPFTVYYLLSSQILPPRFVGAAYAFMNTISLIGGAISPGLAGLLLDVSGTFLAQFAMIAVTALIGLGLALATRER
jgi:NNP family nitrate/nitrite transporter-like MFS transporter